MDILTLVCQGFNPVSHLALSLLGLVVLQIPELFVYVDAFTRNDEQCVIKCTLILVKSPSDQGMTSSTF